jgi:hypothetical protein
MKNPWRFAPLAVLVSALAVAQTGSLPPSLRTSPQSDEGQDSGQSLGELARHARKDHSEEAQLSPEDAKKLFAAVDRIAAFAAEDSGMPLHGPVKRLIVSPEDVENSTRERLSKKEYSDRFARSELTMKKFGLLPRGFDLKEFIIQVQRKEIAGYYDDETKTISLLNTIPVEAQEAVLAHELTHALQDQNYDLRNWMNAGETASSKNVKYGDSDESSAARRAVVEGQAMVVFADYRLAPAGRSLLNSPGLIYRMEDPAVKAVSDSEMLHQAPIIVRATGTFPYHEGLIFEGELLQAGGKKLAFAHVFSHPPRNTHEIMQPRAYLQREKSASLPFPDAEALLGDSYQVYDSGTVGELDVQALLWQLGTRTLAEDLSRSWRGGAYMAFRKKSANAPTTADLKLFYVSRWSSELAAQRFAKFYVDSIPRRYQTAAVNPSNGCSTGDCPRSWTETMTEEGPVIVELWRDNTVLVAESFDSETAGKLSRATHSAGLRTTADSIPQRELGMRLYEVPGFRRLEERLREEITLGLALPKRGSHSHYPGTDSR